MRQNRSGIIAKKMGMTRIFLPSGEACPVTLFSLEECTVLSRRERPASSRVALQVGSGRAKHVTKPMQGHFQKNGVEPKARIKEFSVEKSFDLSVGTRFQPDYFQVGNFVDVTGVTIGRGFAGGMKRHNFGGLRASHGVSVSHRSIGSTGHRKDPAKVFKGKKMPGHMGCVQVTAQSLKVMDLDVEKGLLVVKGCVPGFEGGWVMIRDAVKKPVPAWDGVSGLVAAAGGGSETPSSESVEDKASDAPEGEKNL